jgi:trehalose 6-phosphate phosphatase
MPSFETDRLRPNGRLTEDMAFQLTTARAARCAFFFDFDGTLAPIQDDPETVQPAPGVLEALAALSRRVAAVAIVSARPVEFLRSRFGSLPGVAFFGLYGLEVQRAGGPLETDPSALPFVGAMADLAARARAELPAGTLVEYKRLSVSLHYRTAPQLRTEVERWATARAAESGLRAQPGRMVFELKPPGERDKGSVLREETEGLSCAWYFGDDVADLKAFGALDERESTDPEFTGVRVAVANPETGQELIDAADLHLDHPANVPALLRSLDRSFPSNQPR